MDNWKKSDLYCLNCGKKKLWFNDNGGDYYQGETYLCVKCDCQFNLPHEPYSVDENLYGESLKKLKGV